MSEDLRNPQLTCAALQSLLRAQPFSALTREQLAHLGSCDACMDILVYGALAAPVTPEVPADFAARVCANLPAEPLPLPESRRPLIGLRVSLIVLLAVVCVASMAFALSPHGWMPGGMAGIVLAVLLVTEIITLALWLDSHYSAG